MGNPKRRFSKARTMSRRANWRIMSVMLTECPRCHEPKLPHRVCANCGTYAGRVVIEQAAEKK